MRNDTDPGVTCYFRFDNVKIKRLVKPFHATPFYETTKAGLKIARICATQVGKDNVVEYTETLQPNGEILASGLVRNPMGF
jgi:hypothetical protein